MTAAEELADLRARLAAKVEELRYWGKSAVEGAQWNGTQQFFQGRELLRQANEIERRFLQPQVPTVAEPVFASGEREQ